MQAIVWRCVQPCTAEFPSPIELAEHRAEKHPERIRAQAAFDAVMDSTGDSEMAEAAFALALTDSIAFVTPEELADERYFDVVDPDRRKVAA